MSENETRRCIYCTESKAFDQFNSEHVIQKCMTEGAGIQDILTLEPAKHVACVCIDCNTHLGKTLDEAFGRDSIEGVLRFIKGKKKKVSVSNQHWNRTVIRSSGDGVTQAGSLSKLNFDGEEFFTRPSSQIRLKNIVSGEIESFDEKHFEILKKRQEEFDFSTFSALGTNNQTETEWASFMTKVESLVKAIGRNISVSSEERQADGIEEPIIDCSYDDVLKRAIAKIAFNYMAYVFNELAPDMIFSPQLDAIRSYVREGIAPRFLVVERLNENLSNLPTMSHTVRIQCAFNSDMVISARVCLFNELVWQIVLSPSLPSHLPSIRRGQVWCFDTKQCKRMY